MKKENVKRGADSRRMLRAVLTGTAAGSALTFVLVLLAAWLVVKMQTVPYGAIVPVVLAAELMGAALGGWLCGRISRRYGLALGALCGFCMLVVFLLSGMSAGGTISAVTLLRLSIAVTAGAIGGVFGVNRRRRRRR